MAGFSKASQQTFLQYELNQSLNIARGIVYILQVIGGTPELTKDQTSAFIKLLDLGATRFVHR